MYRKEILLQLNAVRMNWSEWNRVVQGLAYMAQSQDLEALPCQKDEQRRPSRAYLALPIRGRSHGRPSIFCLFRDLSYRLRLQEALSHELLPIAVATAKPSGGVFNDIA